MRSSVRVILAVAVAGLLSMTAPSWAAGPSTQRSARDLESGEAATEELVFPAQPQTTEERPRQAIPKPTAVPNRPANRATATNKAPPGHSEQPRSNATASKKAAVRSPSQTAARQPAPQRVVKAAAFADQAPATEERVAAPKPRAAKSRPTTAARNDVVSEQVYYEEPQSFGGPNPGYHPARVNRKETGWIKSSFEPAAPRGGEMIPAPEGDGEAFMPYSHDGMISYDDGEMFDEGVFGQYNLPGRRYAFLAGGEGLLIRPHFSQAAGMTETTTNTSTATSVFNQDIINFNPGYQGAFRTYLGWRDCQCGDEFRFTYFNYNGSDNLSGTATSNMSVCDFLCNTTPNPGDRVSTHFGLGANLWDFDCIRPFFCVPPCNDPCGPRCHPWDLRWFAGVRVAYINHNISSLVTDNSAPGGIFAQATAANKFTGFGPRLGLQGRKYLGQNGRWSVYARGSGSLLVGNVYQDVTNSTPTGQLPTVTNLVSRNSRIIPVAELELGATWWMLPRFAVTGGWMLMSFWDLGLQETGTIGATPNLDDSNILSFDGFFVRGELVF